MDVIASLLLQLLLQLGVGVLTAAFTLSGQVIVVDCAVDGAYAKAVDAAWQAKRRTGKKVDVECKKEAVPTNSTAHTANRGSDTNAP